MRIKLEETTLSLKEVIYIISIVAGFIFNWYSLKMEIQSNFSQYETNRQLTELRINNISFEIKSIKDDLDKLRYNYPPMYAVKPDDVRLPKRREQ